MGVLKLPYVVNISYQQLLAAFLVILEFVSYDEPINSAL